MKLQSSVMAKDTIIQKKQQLTEWERFFANYTSDGDWYMEYKMNNNKKKETGHRNTNNPILKWSTGPNKDLTKDETQMSEIHFKTCSLSLFIKEINAKQNYFEISY